MCGLVGVIGTIHKKQEDAFRQMFFVNSQRGMHGCGVTRIYNKWEKAEKKRFFQTDKSEEPSSVFAFSKDLDFTHMNKAILGHSRHATIGAINTDNNHPFKAGPIIGMHNGTIRGKFKGSDDFETDSEAFFNLLANSKNPKQALQELHKDTTSVAYCFVWFDARNSCVYLIRNSQRPMKMVKIKDTYYYGSEMPFISWGLDRAKIEVEDEDIQVIDVPVNTLFKFNLQKEPNEHGFLTQFKDYFVPPKPKVTTTTTYYGTYGGNYNHGKSFKTVRPVDEITWWEGVYPYYVRKDWYLPVSDTKKEDDNWNFGFEDNKEDKKPADVDLDNLEGFQVNVGGHRYDAEKFCTDYLAQGCVICGSPPSDADDLRDILVYPMLDNGHVCSSESCRRSASQYLNQCGTGFKLLFERI